MSDGGAQFCHMFLGVNNAGFNIAFKYDGTSTNKVVWTDEGRSNPVFQIQADNNGMAIWYADGDYRMIITKNDGTILYDLQSVRMSSDTATMWEGNFGTSLPAATEKNRNQLFALISASNEFIALYINSGTIPAFTAIAGESKTRELTDLSGAVGSTPSTKQIQFDATDIDVVRDFSVPTDGTDASVALINAINAWKALSYPGVLKFPVRKSIQLDNPVLIDYSVSDGKYKEINFNGCKIVNNLASGICFRIIASGGAFVSNFNINNLWMQQSDNANQSTCFHFGGGGGWLNRNELDHLYIAGFGSGNGIVIDDVGETNISHTKSYGPVGSISSPITSGNGFVIQNTVGGAYLTNAVNIYGLRTEGGLVGVDMTADTDTHFHGVSVWSAYSYGIRSTSAFRGSIFGAHFENNYRQAGSTAAGAHCRLNGCKGNVVLANLLGSTSVGSGGAVYYAKYILDIDVAGATGFANVVTIIGGAQQTKHQDGNYYFGDFGTTGESQVAVIGQKVSHTYDGNANVVKYDGFGNEEVYNVRKATNRGNLTGSVPVNLETGNYHIGTLIGNVTIENPTSIRYANIPNGTKLTFSFLQDITGSRTVTFGSEYIGETTAGLTANRRSRWTFSYEGGQWLQDYAVIDQPNF